MLNAYTSDEAVPQQSSGAYRRTGRETDDDVQAVHQAIKAYQECEHPPATKRAAWLYWIYGHRVQNGLASSHLHLAHEIEPFVSATTGACYPGFDRLLELINSNCPEQWQASTLTKRLTDLVRWKLLVRTDGLKARPKILCAKGGVGSVYVLAAPDGDWDRLVRFYRRREEVSDEYRQDRENRRSNRREKRKEKQQRGENGGDIGGSAAKSARRSADLDPADPPI